METLITLPKNNGGPIHYLGNRNLKHPDFNGHMTSYNDWVNEHFTMILANSQEKKFRRCIEPFAGSASWSVNAMTLGIADEYIINDSNKPLIDSLRMLRDDPHAVKEFYKKKVLEYRQADSKKAYFQQAINTYNQSNDAEKALWVPFIFNHSWGGIVFYDDNECIVYHDPQFNGKVYPGFLEEADLTLEQFFEEVDRLSCLFNKNRVVFKNGDFQNVLTDVQRGDFVAMNPPYPNNERSSKDKLVVYHELYSHNILHQNIVATIDNLEKNGIEYYMTYGRYNPSLVDYVLCDATKKPKNYFRLIGHENCVFGVALDQMYFYSKHSVPKVLESKLIRASEVLDGKVLSEKEAVDKFINLSKTRHY